MANGKWPRGWMEVGKSKENGEICNSVNNWEKKESMEEGGRGMDHEGPCLKNLLFNAQSSGR